MSFSHFPGERLIVLFTSPVIPIEKNIWNLVSIGDRSMSGVRVMLLMAEIPALPEIYQTL